MPERRCRWALAWTSTIRMILMILMILMIQLALMPLSAQGQSHKAWSTDDPEPRETEPVDQDHAELTSLLQLCVVQTPGSGPPRVDYQRLARHRSELQAYLAGLGALDPAQFADWKPNRRLALLINAYNAFTLELILDHYPVASIRDIPEAWTNPRWLLVGETVSLDHIENEMIRKKFKEPRIHAALVCAANGCPPLYDEAFTAEKLSAQLDYQCRRFVRDEDLNRLQRSDETLRISQIFEWFADDFAPRWGKTPLPAGDTGTVFQRSIVGFFAEYMRPPDRSHLRQRPVRIVFREYDWGLNEVR